MDVWTNISDYPNYEVSTSGKIRNLHTKKILATKNDKGYDRVTLYNNGTKDLVSVHRIVAETYLDNPESKKEINHLDGNKTNNNVENLSWCSRSENMKHAYDTGLKHFSGGSQPKKVRIVETGAIYDSLHDCARAINGTYSRISNCLDGTRKTHKKYHLERVS